MTNQLFTKLANIVRFRPVEQPPQFIRNSDGRTRNVPRPSIRSGAARVAVSASRKGVFRTQEYSEAFRNKILRETEVYLTAGLQAQGRDSN